MRKISFNSTSSRETTKESEGAQDITLEKRETEYSDKYFDDPIFSIEEEEKTEHSIQNSFLQPLMLEKCESKLVDDQYKEQLAEFEVQKKSSLPKLELDTLDSVILRKDRKVNFDVTLGEIIGEGNIF